MFHKQPKHFLIMFFHNANALILIKLQSIDSSQKTHESDRLHESKGKFSNVFKFSVGKSHLAVLLKSHLSFVFYLTKISLLVAQLSKMSELLWDHLVCVIWQHVLQCSLQKKKTNAYFFLFKLFLLKHQPELCFLRGYPTVPPVRSHAITFL